MSFPRKSIYQKFARHVSGIPLYGKPPPDLKGDDDVGDDQVGDGQVQHHHVHVRTTVVLRTGVLTVGCHRYLHSNKT